MQSESEDRHETFAETLKEEMRWFGGNYKRAAFLFLLPVICLLFISAIYSRGSARDLPVAVIDYDKSSISRMISRSLDASGAIKIVAINQTEENVANIFLQNEVYGVLVIPKGLERQVKHGEKAGVAFYKSSYNLIVSNTLLSDANTVIRSISGGIFIQKMQAKGFTPQQAMAAAKPVRVQTAPLYNPTYNYEAFLVYPVYLAILQMVLAVAGVFLGNQFRKNFFTDGKRHGNITHLFVIAMLAGLLVSTINLLISILINTIGYGVYMPGQGVATFLLSLVFLQAIFMAGTTAGMLLGHRETAVQVIIFFLTPAFILSGYTYPAWGMPAWVQVFAACSPFTYYLRAFISMAFMQATVAVHKDIMIVVILFMVTAMLSWAALIRKRRA